MKMDDEISKKDLKVNFGIVIVEILSLENVSLNFL